MARFFDLPFEIREHILKYALSVHCTPLPDPWTCEGERKALRDMRYDSSYWGPDHTLYGPRRDETTALFLINRQIHDEAKRIFKRKAKHEMDVMVVNDWELWPTWLSGPVQETALHEVKVTFRLFGHPPSNEEQDKERYVAREFKQWCYYALLERFLAFGPAGMSYHPQREEVVLKKEALKKSKVPEGRFYIKMLVLDIESWADEEYPLPPPDITWPDYVYHYLSHGDPVPNEMGKYGVPPEWQGKKLCSYISLLVAVSRDTDRYARTLYEHVGKIRVLVEGKLKREFDLAERLAHLECGWRREVMDKRRQAGLPVIEPEGPQ